MKIILPALLMTISTLTLGGMVLAQDAPEAATVSASDTPASDATVPAPVATDPAVDAQVAVTGLDSTAPDAVPATAEPVVTPDTIDASAALASASQTMKETATGQVDSLGTDMSDIEADIKQQLALLQPSIDVNLMPSLFFSLWEHDLIISSRRGLTTRPVDSPDDGTGLSTDTASTGNGTLTPSGPREIYLGGIVYVSSKDWTIWINGLRITPTAIPATVMDIKVFKDYVEMDWLDASTNRIFPIRLRTQQRFNLDTKMFLEGQG